MGIAPDGVVDSLGIWDATYRLPEQLEAAAESAAGVTDVPDPDDIDHIVVMGMGGSGIAANILEVVAGPLMPTPVVVSKGYACPSFVNERSLVFAVSFSGDTEETLEAVGAAEVAGAQVMVVTAGGRLGELAKDWGAPVLPVDSAIPMPRAAIGAVSVPPLIALGAMGLFPGAREWVAMAADQLRVRRDELLGPDSMADLLADEIDRSFPLVYGGGGVGSVAALRWKSQVNENAKSPAFHGALPESCHNELAGWGEMDATALDTLSVVHLRHDFEHPQLERRVQFISDAVRGSVAGVHEVRAAGEGRLAQLFDLAMVGDFVSLYLAASFDTDPGPVTVLDDLKRSLSS